MRYIEDVIIGGVDGTLSSFSFLAMLKSAEFPKKYILLILILKLLSDGVSLSLSNYTSRSSRNEIQEALDDQTPDLLNPYAAGMSTFVGFIVFGSIPLFIYHYVLHDIASIWKTAGLILAILFVMGIMKSMVIHPMTPLRGGVEFGFIGMIGVFASISIGLMIRRITGKMA